MSTEPRVMSATGTNKFGYSTMPLKGRRARSNYSVHRKGKGKKKRRLFTAGHGGRKRSDVDHSMKNRPITAKAPGLGRTQPTSQQKQSLDGFRPETVPFTNLGPLGETEPIDEDDKIKQEITREVTGESEKEIADRIANEEVKEESIEEPPTPKDRFPEEERKLDNQSEDQSNPNDNKSSSHPIESEPINNENESPNIQPEANIANNSEHKAESSPNDNSKDEGNNPHEQKSSENEKIVHPATGENAGESERDEKESDGKDSMS